MATHVAKKQQVDICPLQSIIDFMMNETGNQMRLFEVQYTDESLSGNMVRTMQLEAPNLETAYEIMDQNYPDLDVDCIYPLTIGYPIFKE